MHEKKPDIEDPVRELVEKAEARKAEVERTALEQRFYYVRGLLDLLRSEDAQVRMEAKALKDRIADRVSEYLLGEARQLAMTPRGELVAVSPFAITSFEGSPGYARLTPNFPGDRAMVARFTVPVGYRFEFSDDDPYQEVIFTPYAHMWRPRAGTGRDADEPTRNPLPEDFVDGDFQVLLVAGGDEGYRQIYSGRTRDMDPSGQYSRAGRWGGRFIARSGDIVQFWFRADRGFDPGLSALVARVRAGHVVG